MGKRAIFTRAYTYILTAFIFIMICFGFLIYQNTAQTMKQQLGNKCIGIASSVAVIIEDDVEGFKEFCRTLDDSTEYYAETYAKLNKIRRENYDHIAYLYTEVRISENEIMYIIDSEARDDPMFSVPGYIDLITASEREAYRVRKLSIPDEFVTNEYGTLLTCYAPIWDHENNEFIGLVGADVSIDQYNAVMKNQLILIVSSITMLVLILGAALLLSSNRMGRLIERDGLTGLYNKTHFMRCLRQQLKYSARKEQPLFVFMADIDHFKIVNDTYGHPFGDIILREVGAAISKVLCKTDCLARYGGEEFSAFLPCVSSEPFLIAEVIRNEVEKTCVLNEQFKEQVNVTISIGMVQAKLGQTAAEVLDLADKALYKAKETRNTVWVEI